MRVALVAMAHVNAVGGRHQDGHVVGAECPIDLVEGTERRRPTLHAGIDQFTHRASDLADPAEQLGTVLGLGIDATDQGEHRLSVHQVVGDEPIECNGRCVEVVEGQTPCALQRVDEGEARLQARLMPVGHGVGVGMSGVVVGEGGHRSDRGLCHIPDIRDVRR